MAPESLAKFPLQRVLREHASAKKHCIVGRSKKVCELLELWRELNPGQPFDYEMIQVAGSTCDNGQLPHHVSTRPEIDQLFLEFNRFLEQLGQRPIVVTVARSSDDDYCPAEDVDYIQEKAIAALTDIYGKLDVRLAYLERDDIT